MPLLKPTFQPYFADPGSPAPKACNGSYCYPVAAGDIVRQQFIQTPCSGNLVEDPNFESVTVGAELVTNGTFTGSAAGWTLNAPWVYGTNNITYGGLSPTPTAEQSGLGLTTGSLYRISIDGTVGSGGYEFHMGSGAGETTTDAIYATGTFTDDILHTDSDDRIAISGVAVGNVLTIDNVSVKEITVVDWITSGVWNVSNNAACKTTAGTGLLYNNTSDYFTTGDYYKVTFTLSGYAAGSVQLLIDDGTGAVQTDAQTAVTANGLYEYYITASQDGVLGFAPTSDFVGCISLPTVHALRTDYPFQLINPAGDSVDISDLAEYVDDKILLNIDFAALLVAERIDEYGCYRIGITDACIVNGDNLLTDGDFDNQNYDEWGGGVTYPHQFNFDGTGLEFIFEPLEGPNLITNGDFSSGATGWTGFGGGDWLAAGNAATHIPGNTTPLTQTITLGTIPPFPLGLTTWYSFFVTGTTGSVTISIASGTSPAWVATLNDTILLGMVLTETGSQTFSITPTSNFDGTIDNVAVHQTQNPWLNFPGIYHNPITALQAGNYNVDYDIVNNLVDGQTGVVINLDFSSPFGTYGGDTTGANSNTINNYVPFGKVLSLHGKFSTPFGYFKAGRIKIDDVSLYAIEPFEATYISECLNFQVSHVDTTLITAWCDQNAFDMDFENTDYLLQMRTECRSLNPVIPKEAVVSKFSTGNSALKYAQLEKRWQFVTGYMSESALTTLAAMASCDHFCIGDEGESATEYIAEVEEFQPQWRASGDYDLAPAVLNISLKEGGIKFNRHR